MLTNKDCNALLELTKQLISYKSLTPNEAGCIGYIKDYLTPLGFKFIDVNKNETSNLIAIYGDLDKPIFAFAGHVDVVPTGDITKWGSNPFILEEKDDQLYGRGIADMKGAIASFIIAAQQFIANNNIKKNTIVLLLTSDEEGKAVDGTAVIVDYLKKNNIRIKYCIIGEPTSVDILGDVIKVGRRGSLTGHLEIVGNQGHIAYPHLCLNPIHLFAKVMYELSSKTWDNGNEEFPPTSFQFTNINSGIGVDNVIPGVLHARFNLRYNNLHSAQSLQKNVIEILDKYGIQYTITWLDSAKPFMTKKGQLNTAAASAINKVMGINPECKTDGGTSDGRFLVDVCDEVLEFGLNNRYIHQISERIQKSDLIDLVNIYELILENVN